MAFCSDPRLTYLNGLGYNVLKLPREGVDPLEVVGRDNDSLEDLGQISTIWSSKAAVPQVAPPAQAVDINGQRTSDLKVSIGLDILASILQGMGIDAPKVTAEYNQAKSIQFTFTDVQVSRVPPLEVGSYLAQGDLDQQNPFASYFQDHNKEAYVITEVLKSQSITVTAKGSSGTTLAVNLPNIQKVVGVNASIAASASDNASLTYKGQKLLTFGFKVFGIAYANGSWQIHGQAPAGNIAFSLPSEPGPVLLSDGQLLENFRPKATKTHA
jgi:hypothetical protein